MYTYPRTIAAIAAASLLAVTAAQAGKGANYQKQDQGKRFTLTGGANYLEPSLNSLDYLFLQTTDADGNLSDKGYIVDPEFNWGYFVGFGYMISDTYDVQATWTQNNTEGSDRTSATGANPGITAYTTSAGSAIRLAADDTIAAHSTETMNYKALDATLGQYHNLTEALTARLFAGLRYAKITTDIDTNYTSSANDSFFDSYKSSFSGVGPLVGLDLEYQVYDTLGVVGAFGAALLVGNQDASSNTAKLAFLGDPVQIYSDAPDQTRIIPALSGKLGLNWGIPYGTDMFDLGIEAGYQVAYYFDVADQLTSISATNAEYEHHYSDVGVMGPYLNVSAMF